MYTNIKFDFNDISVAVIGGASGIGREVCFQFGIRGADIGILDINRNGAKEILERLEKNSVRSQYFYTDVTSHESLKDSLDGFVSTFQKIDVMIYTASIINRKPFLELTADQIERLFEINLHGPMKAARLALGHMITEGYGRIVLFSSANSSGAKNNSDYAASKAALDSFTRSLSVEIRDMQRDITINSVVPPPTLTDLWSNGRTQSQIEQAIKNGEVYTTEEMISTIMFLSSRESGPISGQIISHKANLLRIPNK
ncbi:MAG: SDR family NAD(P)-dependent oxidoreductase [Thermoplasmata archaeon]